jgi:hypothetical protein
MTELTEEEVYLQTMKAALWLASGLYRLTPTSVTKTAENGSAVAKVVYVAVNEGEDKRVWGYIDSLPELVRKQVTESFVRLKDVIPPDPLDLIPTPPVI